jgi:hypothetical protein
VSGGNFSAADAEATNTAVLSIRAVKSKFFMVDFL